MRLTGDHDLPLLHGFEQGRLHLDGGAIDFVGQDKVAENRAGLELKAPLAAFVVIDLGAGDVRRQHWTQKQWRNSISMSRLNT
jgi:hypothetical protein